MICSNQEFRWIELKMLEDLMLKLMITTILDYDTIYRIQFDSIVYSQAINIVSCITFL
jgi:hypothetical protein